MLKDLLDELNNKSIWKREVTVNGKKVWLQGRVLSPSEVQRASHITNLAIQSIKGKGSEKIYSLSKKLQEETATEEEQVQAAQIWGEIPEVQKEKIDAKQDSTLITCVTHGSIDGERWEPITLVPHLKQTNGKGNLLWIGAISTESRADLIDDCMSGYVEAVEQHSTFLGRQDSNDVA